MTTTLQANGRGVIYIWDHQFEPTRMHLGATLRSLGVPNAKHLASPRRGRFFTFAAVPGSDHTRSWSSQDEAELQQDLLDFVHQLRSLDKPIPIIHSGCAPSVGVAIDALLEKLI